MSLPEARTVILSRSLCVNFPGSQAHTRAIEGQARKSSFFLSLEENMLRLRTPHRPYNVFHLKKESSLPHINIP
jgi:hypothetical protein